ncbi:MAG: hypothetical protein B1H08_05370, partial [Candidatus Omnitrophica bacterium 4484_171]
ILKQAAARELKGKETAALTGCHPVHISRLKKKVMASGIQGILRPAYTPPFQYNIRFLLPISSVSRIKAA